MGNLPQRPSDAILKTLERYDIRPEEGIVIGPQGKPVGCRDVHGHWIITLWDGKKQPKVRRCHIIWWKHHGEWPIDLIDHENRIKDDDRIGNLRMRTHRQNMTNKIGSHGLLVGVKLSENPELPYKCTIKTVYVGQDLGEFKTEEEANEQYTRASRLVAQAIEQVLEALRG